MLIYVWVDFYSLSNAVAASSDLWGDHVFNIFFFSVLFYVYVWACLWSFFKALWNILLIDFAVLVKSDCCSWWERTFSANFQLALVPSLGLFNSGDSKSKLWQQIRHYFHCFVNARPNRIMSPVLVGIMCHLLRHSLIFRYNKSFLLSMTILVLLKFFKRQPPKSLCGP